MDGSEVYNTKQSDTQSERKSGIFSLICGSQPYVGSTHRYHMCRYLCQIAAHMYLDRLCRQISMGMCASKASKDTKRG